MRILDAINELSDTYKSIDVRIFSFMQDNVWKNIFTVIRFRREDTQELSSKHNELIKKCGKLVNTEEFRTDLFQFPLEKWDEILKNFSNKFICLTDDFAVNYFDPVSYNHMINAPFYDTSREYVFKDWKIFFANQETNNSSRPAYNDKLLDHALKNHFSRFDDYLAALLEVNQYYFQSNPWIFTFIPVFFRVEGIEFDDDKVEVKFSSLSQKNLQMAFNFFNGERYGNKSEFIDKKIQNLDLPKNDKLIHDTFTMHLDTKSLGNEFELLITKNNKIVIDQKRSKIGGYWKGISEFTNPIHYIFEKFVDYDKLKKMLFDFESENYKDPSKVFEEGVSWLLSLLGITNILLGKYDTIHDNGKTISTDILGKISKNEIIIVHVTKGLPKQSDFDREKDYRINLSKSLKNPDLKIRSMYFTGSEPTESQDSASTAEVNLIGHSKIALVLERLKKGEIVEAREILIGSDS